MRSLNGAANDSMVLHRTNMEVGLDASMVQASFGMVLVINGAL